MSRFRREENDWTAETGRRLREVLAQEAAAVTPSADALDRIRARTAATARRSFGRPLAMAGAALATAAVVAVAVLVAHHGGGRQPLATTPSTTPTPSAIPSPSAPTSPTPAPTVGPTYQLTLYYVGKRADPSQLLFPEVVNRPVPPEKAMIADAIRALLTTPPNDPDYTSYWPAGTELSGVALHNSTVVVDLTMPQAPTSAPPSAVPSTPAPPAGLGAISVQQLLYTIHGAAPQVTAMELRINGHDITSLWASPITEPIALAQPWEVFSHVWITSPTQGQVITTTGTGPATVTISGKAIVFEGVVNFDVQQDGQTVASGHAQTVGAPAQGDWSASVTLPPGTYTIRAYELSAKDGSITYLDDKTITVVAGSPTASGS